MTTAFVGGPTRGGEHGDDAGRRGRPARPSALGVAAGVVGGLAGAGYGEHVLADLAGRRLAAVLPGGPELWRLAGHAGFLAGAGARGLRGLAPGDARIEAGTSADVPVIEADEADRWVPPTVSGGPGSLVPWAGLGREGRRHALASVRPRPLTDRPAGVPDLSIETVMGEPAAPPRCRSTSGSTARPTPARAGRPGHRRDGAHRRLRPVAARARLPDRHRLRQLRRRRGAAVPDLRRRRLGDDAVLAAALAAVARHGRGGPRAEPAAVAADPRAAARPPRAPARGSCCSARASARTPARTSSCTGARSACEALGIDRALWIGTPYGSEWMHEVTRGDRLDVDRRRVAVVNDHAQFAALAEQRGAPPRYVLLSHDNDGVTKFGLDLLWSPPDWLGPHRPRPEPVDGGQPPRHPAGACAGGRSRRSSRA